MGAGRVLSTGTRLRVTVAVIVLLVNALHGSAFTVLPWALLVIGADLATGAVLPSAPLRPRDRSALALAITVASAAVSGLALTAGAGSLPLVVIPLLRAGETWSRRAFTAVLAAFLVPAVLAWSNSVEQVDDLRPGSLALWGALTVTLAVTALWSKRLAPDPRRDEALASEAAWLLTRLQALASELRGGFDPATSAEHLLDDLPNPGSRGRSTLLIGGPHERPVPLALRGSLRVPWRDPREDDGILGQAWFDGRPGVGPQADGRTLVAVPARDTQERQIGVLVADIELDGMPPRAYLTAVQDVVQHHQGLVSVALAFGGLRERAGIEERERLARHIHDGIAQELVALGFRIDRLKRLPDDEMRPEAGLLRAEVSRILADVRSHIGDLRLTVRPEGGLGAAITSQVQVFGAASGAAVTLRLSESSFRLPAHVETGLYRIVLDFLADARRSGAQDLDVALQTQAPDARLMLRQSGTTRLTGPDLSARLPASLGADVTLTSSTSGTEILVCLNAVPDTAVTLDERLPQTS